MCFGLAIEKHIKSENSLTMNELTNLQNERAKVEGTVHLINVYTQGLRALENDMVTVSGDLLNYSHTYDLYEKYAEYKSIEVRFTHIYECIHDIVEKTNQWKWEALLTVLGDSYSVQIKEEDLYNLSQVDALIEANDKLEAKGNVVLDSDTINRLKEIKVFLSNPTFLKLKPDFATYSEFKIIYDKLATHKANIEKLHDSYEELLRIAINVSKNIDDKDELVKLNLNVVYKMLDSLMETIGFKAGSFSQNKKVSDVSVTSLIETIYDTIFAKPDAKYDIEDHERKHVSKKQLVAIDSDIVIQKIHEKFQNLTIALISDAKTCCFASVIPKYKEASNCLITLPNNYLDEKACSSLYEKATVAMSNCESIFPMKTMYDKQIMKLLKASASVKVGLANDEASTLIFYPHADNELNQEEYSNSDIQDPNVIKLFDAYFYSDNNNFFSNYFGSLNSEMHSKQAQQSGKNYFKFDDAYVKGTLKNSGSLFKFGTLKDAEMKVQDTDTTPLVEASTNFDHVDLI
ncbi:hypothetical protein RFI_02513 [Reticulomyxa filosa]|uniref:Uncharacterized protein n=1 Tax=Reticulomyxa filosa TaxID=46433 RepID=X6P931_RETFI|nr:hypothetical protein RFI_02513 [Reticulomyxa filosa]|eukprot:ETO34574.1 hypothetical protein RFI_02513 [Reticulomyxa filosa]